MPCAAGRRLLSLAVATSAPGALRRPTDSRTVLGYGIAGSVAPGGCTGVGVASWSTFHRQPSRSWILSLASCHIGAPAPTLAAIAECRQWPSVTITSTLAHSRRCGQQQPHPLATDWTTQLITPAIAPGGHGPQVNKRCVKMPGHHLPIPTVLAKFVKLTTRH